MNKLKTILLLCVLPLSAMTKHHPSHARYHKRIVRSCPGTPQIQPMVDPRVLEIRQEHKEVMDIANDIIVPISIMTPQEEENVIKMMQIKEHVVEIQAREQETEVKAKAAETKAISKRKIAGYVAATSIISAIVGAGVTLAVHFSDCKP